MEVQANMNPKHLLCSSQHIIVLIATLGKLYLDIGPIWVGLVPPDNYATKTLWSHTGSHFL